MNATDRPNHLISVKMTADGSPKSISPPMTATFTNIHFQKLSPVRPKIVRWSISVRALIAMATGKDASTNSVPNSTSSTNALSAGLIRSVTAPIRATVSSGSDSNQPVL